MRFFLFLFISLSAFSVDFDCIFIGSSPFSLFEALYQSHSGKKVLLIEEAVEFGGAWRSITVCGIPHADLGCHQIGHDPQLKTFLEEYAGCNIVSLDHPETPFYPSQSLQGYYFSQGCFELIDHLLKLIHKTDIVLLNQTRVEKVALDVAQQIAFVETAKKTFTTSQLIVTPMSCFDLISSSRTISSPPAKSKYYHLYLLIQDPTPPRFSYQNSSGPGISRLMNLTHFVELAGTGRQLIVIQTHQEEALKDSLAHLEVLKKQQLVDESAYLLQEEVYIYEAGSCPQKWIAEMGAEPLVKILQTSHFQLLSQYISRWQPVLKPYREIIREGE